MVILLIIGLLIALYVSGYLVAVYALAIFVDPEDVEKQATNESYTHNFLRKLTSDPRAFRQLATLYKSLVLILVSILSVQLAARLLPVENLSFWGGLLFDLVLIWPLYLLVVEYLPRRHSRTFAHGTSPQSVWVVVIVHAIFNPLSGLFRRSFGRKRQEMELADGEREELVERAIETLADDAGVAGEFIAAEEKQMISQIFLLDETMAREIMVPRLDVAAIDRTMSLREVQELVLKEGYSRYPVFEGTIDKVIGLLYAKDLLGKLPGVGEQFKIENYLRAPYFIPETKIIRDLLRDFKTRRQHIAVVVDEFGGVAGLVTLEDILEEIVGDIQDEHDVEEAEFIKMPDGTYRVDAAMHLEELQDLLDVEYDKGDYDTVGGLIYDLVGSVPQQGQQVAWNDLRFVVERVEGQRILSVSVVKQS